MYFQYEGVYISPYVENGISQQSVLFNYDFCKQVPTPKYPSNYQRHCNLMSAGIVRHLSSHLIIINYIFKTR